MLPPQGERPYYPIPEQLPVVQDDTLGTDSLAVEEPDTLITPAVFIPSAPYTGLLVDARGLDLQPSMAPRLFGADGREVYSPSFVARDYAATIGVVGYDKDYERALTSDRLASSGSARISTSPSWMCIFASGMLKKEAPLALRRSQ